MVRIGSAVSLVQVLSIGFALAICASPLILLRRDMPAPTTPAIVRNATVAYLVRVSLVVPLFALGAAEDIWPVIVAALGLAAGCRLRGALRMRPGMPGSTLPAFLAEACGGDGHVRRAAALVTILGLLGLVGAEAAAVGAVMGPVFGSEGAGTALFVATFAAVGLVGLTASARPLLYVAQALLGAIFIGLIGAGAFLVYLLASDLRPLPPHGALALLALASACAALLAYRQSKYVETPPLVSPGTTGWRRSFARLVRMLQRLANVAVSVFAGLALVLTGMAVYALGPAAILREALAAFGAAPRMPAIGVAAVAILATAYPLVDGVIWRHAADLAEAGRREMRLVARESAIFVVVAAAFGALAILAADLPSGSTAIADLIRQLALFDHPITDAALSLLLVALAAMASAMMAPAIGGALAVARADILPNSPGSARALIAAIGVAVAVACLALGGPSAGLPETRFFATALGFACLPLALVPLLVARWRDAALPRWSALAGMATGITASLCCIAVHAATGDQAALAMAVPAAIAPGLVFLGLVKPQT